MFTLGGNASKVKQSKQSKHQAPLFWATKREGVASEVLPLQKEGGAEQVLAMLKVGRCGHTQFCGSFNTGA